MTPFAEPVDANGPADARLTADRDARRSWSDRSHVWGYSSKISITHHSPAVDDARGFLASETAFRSPISRVGRRVSVRRYVFVTKG